MNLANMVDFALRQVGPPVKQVYKRITPVPTGSNLLGLYTSTGVAPVDTLVSPQPAYVQLQDRASVLSTSSLALEASDFEIIFSANSIAITELEASNLSLVFNNTVDGVTEEYRILGYNPAQFQGAYAAFTVYARRVGSTALGQIALPGSSSASSVGDQVTVTASTTISAYTCVSVVNGSIQTTNSADVTQADSVLGLATQSGTAGTQINVQYGGTVTYNGWNWPNNDPVFVTANGTLTQTVPTTGFSKIIGFPLGSTTVLVQLQPSIILD